ncbi:PHA accumulation regulator DNA-binding-like protein [Planktothrix agardhii CCAP 1459/11A]|uniref:PHA accumulation regulator DNA-binding-like protein n=1 Tax=Planktothrix agardhii CCAP 1459/11A TaxID=282420 RepID=A0A479ZPT9_PLAAG|nr:type IV pilin-like G/H family protein [Planktothrix agardhii]GCL34202.1 PHA accumulation regulator DNA-binding-like protein [Planktothrix agardhii CCAP 1459/11A]
MKTEFKAKFLQYVSNRKKEEGFTLIELLVVIIIIGILAAIALPSFLNQANKAKQSEGKQYISSLNKGQQAYYAEKTAFGTTVEDLGIGIKSQTSNYSYELGAAANTGVDAISNAKPSNTSALKGYAGNVFLVTAGDAKTTSTVLCETSEPGNPSMATGKTSCTEAGGMKDVK